VDTAGEPDESAPQFPELSPDGRRLAITRLVQSNFDVWLADLMRSSRTRFTFDAAFDMYGVWSPDGTRIAFSASRASGARDLYVKPSSGAGDEELLWESALNKAPLSWSSDGRFLLYWEVGPKTGFDLWILEMLGERKAVPWLKTPFTETGGQFSPDGRWVAYQSNESGPFEIYVQPYPAGTAKWQISANGGTMPRWRPDGKELFFIAPDTRLMAATVTVADTTFETAPPVALFQTHILGGHNQILRHNYAVSRDGRFLINEPADESTAASITLILHWTPRL
jgi:Tol biopolymer transport system component